MPRIPHPEPDPVVLMLSPAPGSELQRAQLYATGRGRFNKMAWHQTGAGVTLLQAIHQTPLWARLGHFQRHSPQVRPPT